MPEPLIEQAELVVAHLGQDLVQRGNHCGYLLWRAVPPDGLEFVSVGPRSPACRRLAPGGLDDLERLARSDVVGSCAVLDRSEDGSIVVVHVLPEAPKARDQQVAGVGLSLDPAGCGDGWAVTWSDTGLMTVVLVDGLGHGPLAGAGADAVLGVLTAGYDGTPEDFVRRANAAAITTRGGALGWCSIDPVRGVMHFAGVGNIAGRIYLPDRTHGLTSRPGSVGISQTPPRIRRSSHPWTPGAAVVLHTDGVRVMYGAGPKLPRGGPLVLAAGLLRDHSRDDDDATVVVITDARAQHP